MSNKSGFEEVNKYEKVKPAPRWEYGPREATGTLVNGICMSLGGAMAFFLEELAIKGQTPIFSIVQDNPIAASVTLGLVFRVLAYFLKNGGSSAIGEVVVKVWEKVSKKEVLSDD